MLAKDLSGSEAFVPSTNRLALERGVPNEKWFQKNGSPFYLLTDFVFSIPFGANLKLLRHQSGALGNIH
jgi:hypothetical protein